MMTDNTLNHTHADKGSDLRPWVLAVVMVAAGLGLLFWDNDPGDGTPAPAIVISQIR
jgi:hypothetical protein